MNLAAQFANNLPKSQSFNCRKFDLNFFSSLEKLRFTKVAHFDQMLYKFLKFMSSIDDEIKLKNCGKSFIFC